MSCFTRRRDSLAAFWQNMDEKLPTRLEAAGEWSGGGGEG